MDKRKVCNKCFENLDISCFYRKHNKCKECFKVKKKTKVKDTLMKKEHGEFIISFD